LMNMISPLLFPGLGLCSRSISSVRVRAHRAQDARLALVEPRRVWDVQLAVRPPCLTDRHCCPCATRTGCCQQRPVYLDVRPIARPPCRADWYCCPCASRTGCCQQHPVRHDHRSHHRHSTDLYHSGQQRAPHAHAWQGRHCIANGSPKSPRCANVAIASHRP
jgi:hypothetical protein